MVQGKMAESTILSFTVILHKI